MRGLARAPRLLILAATLVVGVALLLTACFAIGTLLNRPLDGVEGDILFEAKRIREGLPLWTSPEVGALEHGAPPSRYYVLYPPLWSATLALVPARLAPTVARAVALLGWTGLLAWLLLRMPAERRRAGLGLTLFFASSYLLAFYATSGRPDGVAVVLMGIALGRSVHQRRLDVLSGALFALAAWTKPNVVGAFPGVVLAMALTGGSRRARVARLWPGLAAVVALSAAVALVLGHASDGAWVQHLLASTVQPPSLSLLATHLASRAPMFAVPLLLVLALALRTARGAPGADGPTPAAIAAGALATSLAWCVLSFAKTGSAANYLLEPVVCALVAFAHVDLPRPERFTAPVRTAFAALVVFQVSWPCAASMQSAWAALRDAPARAAFVGRAREACGARTGEVVLADEPGLEMSLNGRLIQTPFQSTHLARRGRFPVDAWVADVGHPAVACFVAQDDLLERDLGRVDAEHDRLPVAVRARLRERLELVRTEAGLYLYGRRGGRANDAQSR